MRTAQRIGTLFLLIGSLIVLSAILLWLVAPSIKPATLNDAAHLSSAAQTASAPALSPFIPQASAPIEEVSPAVSGDSSSSASNGHTISHQMSSSNWNVISYAEARLLGAHNKTLAGAELRLSIPALDIQAPILPVTLQDKHNRNGRTYRQWDVPNQYAVGWHDSSAPPGQVGNTVLNGHNNIYGSIFGNLVDLTLGEQIILYEANRQHTYQVVHREFLPETGEPLRTRLRNARWIAPSNDTRLTIVTCWPNSSNSHRLVVVALPLESEPG